MSKTDKKMDERVTHFWRLRATFQELFGVSDEEIEEYPEIAPLLGLCANLALSFKEKGVRNTLPSMREKMLEEIGVAVLKRRGK